MKGGRYGRWIVGAVAFPLSLPLVGANAFAGSFAVREQSARAQGSSFAGAAAGAGGLSSILWNPASIAFFPGIQSEGDIGVSRTRTSIKPDFATRRAVSAAGGAPVSSGDIGQPLLNSAGYGSYQVNDRFWVGAAIASPYHFTTKPRQDWAGQTLTRSSRLNTIAATPMVGYKVNDWVTLGAGVTFQSLDVTFKNATGVAPRAPSAILDGGDVGFGFSLGATIQPRPGTMVGIGFRSMVHHDLHGNWLPASGLGMPIRGSLNLPETISVGVTQRLSDQWNLLAGGEWTNWSRLKQPTIVDRRTGQPVGGLAFHYQDGTFVSLGVEYLWKPELTMRAGLGFETSPDRDDAHNPRLPDADRIWTSIGASYQASEKLGFDIGYSHAFTRQAPVRVTGASADLAGLAFIGDAKPSTDIISVAWRYRWDAPSKPALAINERGDLLY
jgi:long-chain fatty acid transport protein